MLKHSSISIVKSGVDKYYEIHCPNFVPKKWLFLPNFCQGLSQTVAFSLFSRQFYDFDFLLKFLLFQPRSPSKKFTFVLNFWLLPLEKSENSTICIKNEKLVEF